MNRCAWCLSSPLMQKYHDDEWGKPVHDDKILFEFIVLESAQAGLSWSTILNKRENYRRLFHNFDYKKIAKYSEKDVKRLMKDAGIIRNRLKILATITNAKCFMAVQKEFGSFSKYMWRFVNNKPIVNRIKSIKDIKATSKESDAFSKDLKARGFKFMGSTIVYAHMQAVGMVNDHELSCFRKTI
jgi:DNA-3-methyladenine glycosylase I